jgi:hypothetical protein
MPAQVFDYSDSDADLVSLLTDTSEKKANELYAAALKGQLSSTPPARAAISGGEQASHDYTGQVVFGMALITLGGLLVRSFCRGRLFKTATKVEKKTDPCPERQVLIVKP